MINNPIIVVDDDADDLDLIREVANDLKLPNQLFFLSSGDELVDHLEKNSLSPFLVICDVNLPGEDGFSVRERVINKPQTRYKSVPFVFWSTAASPLQVQKAYDLPAQGFFVKPTSYSQLQDTLTTIVHYWQLSQHPKS